MKKINLLKTKTNLELAILIVLFLVFLGFTIYQNLTLKYWQHFSLLAESFLHGRFDISEKPEMLLDTILGRGGKYYFGVAPLPAVLMMPFVYIFGHRAPQGYLDIVINVINIFLVNKLLLTFSGTKKIIIRLWFILIFFFATNMVSVIWSPHPWFLAENIGILFTLWLILEWRGRKRLWLLFPIIILLALSKKNMAFPIFSYFLVDSIYLKEIWRKKVTRMIILSIAVAISFLALFLYQNIGSTSATLLNYYDNARIEPAQLDKIKKYGIWSISHIPTNFFNYILAGPIIFKENTNDLYSHIRPPYIYPSFSGISIFYTSPIFLSLLFLPLGDKKKYFPILAAVLVWLAVYFTFYASGAQQFGARYFSEAVPFVFLALLEVLPLYFSYRIKGIVVFSMVLNVYMFIAFTSALYINP